MLEEVLAQSIKQVGWALVLLGVAYVVSLGFHKLRKRPAPPFSQFSGFSWHAHLSTRQFYRDVLLIGFVSALLPGLLLNVSAEFRELILSPNSPAGRIARSGLSLSAVAAAFLYCFLQSSLAEEILFRGLLGKRLIAWLGFRPGNSLQAAVFALLHLAILQLVLKTSAPALQALSVLVTFALGYFLGWYNEKKTGGSLVPAVFMHGLGNFLGYLVVLYWTLQK